MRHKKSYDLKSFLKGIKKHQHFLLSCHVQPDADAIGSLLALDSLLRRLGKKTTIVHEEPIPKHLNYFVSKKWKSLKELKRHPQFDALITTDCPSLDRIGGVQKLVSAQTAVFNIDHHISNDYFGTYHAVNTKAVATAEIIYDLFKALRLPIQRKEAEPLYIALSTDTVSFKASSTNANSHVIAADLIGTGIDLERIHEDVYSNFSEGKVLLYQKLFNRIQVTNNGQVVWSTLKETDLKATKTTVAAAEGFIDILRAMKKAKIVFLIHESSQKLSKVSFRSKRGFRVDQIAVSFGGGGHRQAAGCSVLSSAKETEKKILKAVRGALKA